MIKKLSDIVIHQTPFCGEIREILALSDYQPVGIALAIDIQSTIAHYHQTFDEIYFVLDGTMTLELYDPQQDRRQFVELAANELCVVAKGVHHRISKASPQNRLCVVSTPSFQMGDEYPSDQFERS